ncbi:4'-phosphopantetheinyl transferase superfamily protein [Sinomonas sp. ASV322]|uniref:4'-phosphopantetheinyl transferase family protein n=1 Tax=Sinomonas sp. ASV322 TaxID=3041920 RepID=UPI0027DCBD0D|nr:4'-phosphopantetheinyl transferase superfamily protein [Sinomonas sp. ASV322]MDQ4502643.1 4'-phosphopantetheinyl transferase superfamily protein [Sinomonas sp. ASV322]
MMLRAVPLGHQGSPLPVGLPTEGEALRARAFTDARQAHEFLAGRLALRGFVAEAVGAEPEAIVPLYWCPACGAGEHGAPGFALAASDDDGLDVPRPARLPVAASMSRAAGWALLAVEPAGGSASVRVGVDLARPADFATIPEAAFSPSERVRLADSRDARVEAARLWARKEALLKALGTGLRTDPATVETLGDPRVVDVAPHNLGLPTGFVAAAALL